MLPYAYGSQASLIRPSLRAIGHQKKIDIPNSRLVDEPVAFLLAHLSFFIALIKMTLTQGFRNKLIKLNLTIKNLIFFNIFTYVFFNAVFSENTFLVLDYLFSCIRFGLTYHFSVENQIWHSHYALIGRYAASTCAEYSN